MSRLCVRIQKYILSNHSTRMPFVCIQRRQTDVKTLKADQGRLIARSIKERHMEVLEHFAKRINVDPSIHGEFEVSDTCRYPAVEFRSLVMNMVGRLVTVDQSLWKKNKVQLCSLLQLTLETAGTSPELVRASSTSTEQIPSDNSGIQASRAQQGLVQAASCSDASVSNAGTGEHSTGLISEALEQLMEECFQKDRQNVVKLMADERIPEAQKLVIQAKLEAKMRSMAAHVTAWCQETSQHPDFVLMQPFLRQVLQVQPEPLLERAAQDGNKTEEHMFQLIGSHLPEGWTLHRGANILKVNGQPFLSQRSVKMEADLLLVDPAGVVQAVVEVKTASGNFLLALYEDIVRLLALMDQVKGQAVTFSLADRSSVTLQFSPHLRPLYLLGSELNPAEVDASALSAQHKLMALEVARMLSSKVSSWGCIHVLDINPESVTLHISSERLRELRGNVRSYFEALAGCDIYSLQPAA